MQVKLSDLQNINWLMGTVDALENIKGYIYFLSEAYTDDIVPVVSIITILN